MSDEPVSEIDPRVVAAFDPEAFRRAGHAVVERLADYLVDATELRAMPVLPPARAEALRAAFGPLVHGEGERALLALLDRALTGANHLHHPRYVGHQVAPPLPLAALAELVSSLLNNSMSVFEMAPVGTVIEERVIEWMIERVGFGKDSDGVLTSGGTLGNLTALLAARGNRKGGAILASADAHYSLARAARVMGDVAYLPVAIDDARRMTADAAQAALAAARAAGQRPFALVATAGSTAVGAFDPLVELAALAEREGLHLHVDGAHGASAILSSKYRHLVDGLDRASTIVWDAHKMMLVPSLVTGVLFRDGALSYSTFVQDASYLLGPDAHAERENRGHRTFECTRSTMALRLYAALSAYGEPFFDATVTRAFDLARRFAGMLDAARDFELAIEPEANIVCFRYLGIPPGPAAERDALQKRIRERIIASGAFYLVEVGLGGALYLRTTLMNPLTTERDLDDLMGAIRDAGR